MDFHALQVWLVASLDLYSPFDGFMHSRWGWPLAESVHFIGLCLLVGCVGTFDLRLLGVGRSAPIAAVHRLIPFGILGFAINVCSGLLFVLTEPDQYIYNPSFHFKLLFLTIAGLNAGTFYLTSYRQVFGRDAASDAPFHAKLIAAVSLSSWICVIVGGRLLTFFRPGICDGVQKALLLTCAP